jgi:hypothetical protein
MKRYNSLALSLIGTAVIASPGVSAQSMFVGAPNTSVFLNGGIGEDEADDMRRQAREFPLRLVFAEGPHNDFTANVPVAIADARGDAVFAMTDAGPMLYWMLPEGSYTVTAESDGIVKTQRVRVSHGQGMDVVFHWGGEALSDRNP